MKDDMLAEILGKGTTVYSSSPGYPQGEDSLSELQVAPARRLAAFMNYHCEGTMQTLGCCLFSP